MTKGQQLALRRTGASKLLDTLIDETCISITKDVRARVDDEGEYMIIAESPEIDLTREQAGALAAWLFEMNGEVE